MKTPHFFDIAERIFERDATKHVAPDKPGHMLASDFYRGPFDQPEAYGVIQLGLINGYQVPHFVPVYTVGMVIPVWYPNAGEPFGEILLTAIERVRLHAMRDDVIPATGLSFDEWRAEWDRLNPHQDWRKNPAVIIYTFEARGVYTDVAARSDENSVTTYGVRHE